MVSAMAAVKATNIEVDGFQETEIGMLPSDWNLRYVEEFCKVSTGGRNTQDRVADGDFPFFVRSQTIENIDSYSYDEEAILTAGDGVGTGKVFHYICGKYDAHQRVYRMFDFSDDVSGKYFFRYFSENFYARIMQMTAKSSVDSVRRDMITRMPIALPKFRNEQEAIAEALNDADALIESLEQLIAKKRQIKQGAMQELLTGKRRLEGFIAKWETVTLGDVVEKIVGGGTPARWNESYWNGPIPWMTVKDFANFSSKGTVEYISEIAIKKSATHLIPSGTVITSTRMALGKAAIYEVDVCINQDLKALFVKSSMDTKYLFHWFKFHEPRIADLGSGSTVMGITLSELKKIPFLKPSRDEQKSIAEFLDQIDCEIADLQRKTKKFKDIKQGMMQELLTGRIRLV